jgi:hypothetical protein
MPKFPIKHDNGGVNSTAGGVTARTSERGQPLTPPPFSKLKVLDLFSGIGYAILRGF